MEIPATEFKAKGLKLMDNVAKTREPVIITKRGKPIAKLVPAEEQPKSLFGCMKGTVEILGDIVSPLEVEWETEISAGRYARSEDNLANERPTKPVVRSSWLSATSV